MRRSLPVPSPGCCSPLGRTGRRSCSAGCRPPTRRSPATSWARWSSSRWLVPCSGCSAPCGSHRWAPPSSESAIWVPPPRRWLPPCAGRPSRPHRHHRQASGQPGHPVRTGVTALLGSLLLVGVVSVGRWRRWPQPVAPQRTRPCRDLFLPTLDRPNSDQGLHWQQPTRITQPDGPTTGPQCGTSRPVLLAVGARGGRQLNSARFRPLLTATVLWCWRCPGRDGPVARRGPWHDAEPVMEWSRPSLVGAARSRRAGRSRACCLMSTAGGARVVEPHARGRTGQSACRCVISWPGRRVVACHRRCRRGGQWHVSTRSLRCVPAGIWSSRVSPPVGRWRAERVRRWRGRRRRGHG